MKTIGLSFFISFFSLVLKAQTEQLVIKSGSKGPYVEHKVAAKENFYSIGRLFNVHPKHLALFNSLDMSKGLHLGQAVRIPLTDTNFTHKSEIGTPVYYITGSNETIYNVSTNNNVLMEKLRKWNQLPSDKLPGGSKLIVGYLMNGQTQAIAVNNTQPVETVSQSKPGNSNKEVVKNEVISKPDVKKEDRKNEVVNKPAAKKEESKNDVVNKPEIKKEESKPGKDEAVKIDVDQSLVKDETIKVTSEGYFKTFFDLQIKQQPITKEQTLTSGIFKTSSGWSDAKYYLLMDGAEPGTIVKITNPANKKIIYAKLLGEMNDLRQNQGLNIRISNAAAAALDIADADKFIVKLNY